MCRLLQTPNPTIRDRKKRARAWLELKAYDRLLEESEAILAVEPNNSTGYSFKWQALHLKKDRAGAEGVEREVQRRFSNDASFYVDRAFFYLSSPRTRREAIPDLERAAQIDLAPPWS